MNRDRVGADRPDLVVVGPDRIDESSLLGFVADHSAGCSVLFIGTVRDHSPGRDGVTRLEYEAYAGVAEDKIRTIIAEARDTWKLTRVAAAHRTGSLDVGEVTVAVAVSAGHRADAFPAARYLIDELKARVPIWKKEHWPGGAEWVAGA